MAMGDCSDDATALLEGVPLFSGLETKELQLIESAASRKHYRKNTVVMERGDESTSLYVLLSGKVKVFVSDEEGKELVLSVLEPGAHLGELSLLGAACRTASVMTCEDSRFLIISKQDFVTCLTNNPQVNLNLIRHLVERIQLLTERVGTLVLRDVYGRLTVTLQELAQQEQGRLMTGRVTQQELGEMVGASREMVSRILKELKQGGYIDIEHKRIEIKKKLPARW